jgi:hypothetical protein
MHIRFGKIPIFQGGAIIVVGSILSKLQVPITREVEITSASKFENCNSRKGK